MPASEIADFQSSQLVIANDDAEVEVYSRNVLAGSIQGVQLYRVLLTGSISTRALLPGSITMRCRFGSANVTLFSETPLAGLLSARFVSNMDFWCMPGSPDIIGLGGFFVQDGVTLFTGAGARINSSLSATDFNSDQWLSVTFQFGTADADNIFTRKIASLLILTG